MSGGLALYRLEGGCGRHRGGRCLYPEGYTVIILVSLWMSGVGGKTKYFTRISTEYADYSRAKPLYFFKVG